MFKKIIVTLVNLKTDASTSKFSVPRALHVRNPRVRSG